MSAKPHATYKRTQISTSDPRRIVVLLYDGAISRLNQAVEAHGRGDRASRTVHVNKALDIIHFLTNSLDFERGGEIALNLQRLYDYIRDIITLANIEGTPEKFTEAIRLLTTLLDAWRSICADSTATPAPEEDFALRTREIASGVAAIC
ncbi:flagellar export chaperone FliS [Candidatus Sumerlaeota bacterium]|nr:flagellar export chaperone FliS [Candidatus Sumerlaeota bacterium]